MLEIKIRIDDFPQGEPDKRYTKQNIKMIELLEAKQISYVLGVVPELVSYYDIDFLKTLKYSLIGMHGFNHGLDIWRPTSEFDLMDCKKIEIGVIRGLNILKDFNIEWFIPPFNMFNQILLNILAEYKFKFITGGVESYTYMNYNNMDFNNLKFVLSKPPFYTSNGNINGILNLIDKLPENEMITFHLCGNYI
jgi:hypothetical protein